MLKSGVYSTSPATTPGSVDDEELLPSFRQQKKQPQQETSLFAKILYSQPLALISISCLQIFLFFLTKKFHLKDTLRFEPDNQKKIWRFVTYMLVHSDWLHLTQNIILQCLFAYHLEKHQKWWRVVALYVGSGATGALGASCFRPEDVIGASAGVYGLLMSHLAHLIINEELKHKVYKLIGVIIIVIFDVMFNVVHYYYNVTLPLISWGAHIFGATTGLLLGLALFSDCGKPTQSSKTKTKICHITGTILFISMLIVLSFVNYQIWSRNYRH